MNGYIASEKEELLITPMKELGFPDEFIESVKMKLIFADKIEEKFIAEETEKWIWENVQIKPDAWLNEFDNAKYDIIKIVKENILDFVY